MLNTKLHVVHYSIFYQKVSIKYEVNFQSSKSSNYEQSVYLIQSLPKPFLSSCFPNLQLYRLPSNIHNFRTELYADSMARILFNCYTSKTKTTKFNWRLKLSGQASNYNITKVNHIFKAQRTEMDLCIILFAKKTHFT